MASHHSSTIIMTSIRQQVFALLDRLPDISFKDLCLEFKDCPKNTIKVYKHQHKVNNQNIPVNIADELIKIIKDYKQPASARVQAIREYNNLIKDNPQQKDDNPLLKLLETLEKDTSNTPK